MVFYITRQKLYSPFFEKSGKKYVQIKTNQNNIVDTEITVGEESSLGQLEIVSGIKEGDQVILNPVVK